MSNLQKVNSKQINPKQKRKFKIPPSIVIILAILFFVIFLSWVLQGKSVQGMNPGEVVVPVGFLSFGNLIIAGFSSAADIIFYLFILGWFLTLLMQTGTLEQGVKSLMTSLKGKEILIVPIMFLLFAFGGTAFGMQEETLGLYIIIIPFFLLAGFDTMTGLLVILLGTTTGIASSIINPFSVGMAYSVVPSVAGSYSIGDGIFLRVAMFVLFTSVGITFVTTYAYRVKKNSNKSLTKSSYESDIAWAKETMEFETTSSKMSKKHFWGLIVFASAFIMMFFMLIPWTSFFNYSTPDQYPTWISWLMNGFALPGQWGFGELIVLFTIASFILATIFRMKGSQVLDAFWIGTKDMISVALLIAIARAIPAALSNSHLDIFFAYSIANGLSGISQLGWTYAMFFVFLLFAFFIPSSSGLAMALTGIFTGSAYTLFIPMGSEAAHAAIISTIIAYTVAIGMMNMITPTQATVMASIEKSRISYGTAIKPILLYMSIIAVSAMVVIFPLTTLL